MAKGKKCSIKIQMRDLSLLASALALLNGWTSLADPAKVKVSTPLYETQVCAAELAAAKWLAIREAEADSFLCGPRQAKLIESSTTCTLNSMRRCRYQGWDCSIVYSCVGKLPEGSYAKRIYPRTRPERSSSTQRSLAQVPDRQPSADEASCHSLDRRLKLCLPHACENSEKIWNIQLTTRYEVHGRPGGDLCRFSQIQKNQRGYNISDCRVPSSRLGEFVDFLTKTVSQAKKHKISYEIQNARLIATIDGRAIPDPAKDSTICSHYYFYAETKTCHELILGTDHAQKKISCAFLEHRFPYFKQATTPPEPL